MPKNGSLMGNWRLLQLLNGRLPLGSLPVFLFLMDNVEFHGYARLSKGKLHKMSVLWTKCRYEVHGWSETQWFGIAVVRWLVSWPITVNPPLGFPFFKRHTLWTKEPICIQKNITWHNTIRIRACWCLFSCATIFHQHPLIYIQRYVITTFGLSRNTNE